MTQQVNAINNQSLIQKLRTYAKHPGSFMVLILTVFAASRTVVPSGTDTAMPSIVKFTIVNPP